MNTPVYAPLSDMILEQGPEQKDYLSINRIFQSQYAHDRKSFIDRFSTMRNKVKAFHDKRSIAGFCYLQPYGYAGDFELIDRLYTGYISDDPAISNWDAFAQAQPAAVAVRNRKAYFINLLERKRPLRVLNIASGPCRDIKEYYERHPLSATEIDCVEVDGRAIEFAKNLLSYVRSVHFIQQNVISFKIEKEYDLVWSAGLFDYFNDNLFVRILSKLIRRLPGKSEIVIGNFSDNNPNRAFMEVGMNWHLHHRSPEQLIHLAIRAGASDWNLRVEKEPEGINLFLHLSKKA
ncbi:MAG TPA: class I SAM-dependent methyltransferase [Chitinophagaceae bacterium]